MSSKPLFRCSDNGTVSGIRVPSISIGHDGEDEARGGNAKRLGMFRYKSGSQEIALERVNYARADGEVIAEFSFTSKLAIARMM